MGVYLYEHSEERSRCCLQWFTGDGMSRTAGRAAPSSQASVMVASEALLVNPRSSLTLLESFPFATAVSSWVLSLRMAGDARLGAARPWPGLAVVSLGGGLWDCSLLPVWRVSREGTLPVCSQSSWKSLDAFT